MWLWLFKSQIYNNFHRWEYKMEEHQVLSSTVWACNGKELIMLTGRNIIDEEGSQNIGKRFEVNRIVVEKEETRLSLLQTSTNIWWE